MTSAGQRATRLADFARSQRGTTAIEFGFIIFPFLLLLFAILEVGFVFWSSQALETAVANASRKVYTGSFQTDPANATKTPAQMQAAFKTELCKNIQAMFDCNLVNVDIRNFSYSSGQTAPSPVTNNAYDASGYSYQNVGARQIALVTASMQYPSLMKILPAPGTLANGNRLIMATATFRTEPYN